MVGAMGNAVSGVQLWPSRLGALRCQKPPALWCVLVEIYNLGLLGAGRVCIPSPSTASSCDGRVFLYFCISGPWLIRLIGSCKCKHT